VRAIGTDDSGADWGVRFYLSYAGSAPTGANCVTLADGVESAWVTDLTPLMHDALTLTEVDVLDIATDSGLSGQWNGSEPGTRSGVYLPVQVCANVEYGIARRYRGGKPRCYFPFGCVADLLDQGHWSNTFVGGVNSGVEAFFTAVEALDVGAMGALNHVNLSFYQGFTNITNSSGRERAVPKYRDVALLDSITGYSMKAVLGSQKRRRTATTA
jgi:hypothetical protein